MSVRDLPTKNNLIKLQAFIKQSKQGHKLLEKTYINQRAW